MKRLGERIYPDLYDVWKEKGGQQNSLIFEFVLYLFTSSSTSRLPSFQPPQPPVTWTSVVQHLGGALRRSRGVRGGPSGFELGLVGASRLRGRRGAQVASLLEVALVAGGLGQHLHPPLLVLLQASPELCALPLPLQLSAWEGNGRIMSR